MIPLWAISGTVAAALAFGAGWHLKAQSADARIARLTAAYDQERVKAAEAAGAETRRLLAQLQAQQDATQKVQEDGQAKLASAMADRDTANRRAASLRDTATTALNALRRPTPEAPATPTECEAGAATARVFAGLFEEANSFAGIVAEEAKRARIHGEACERAYEVTR